MDYREFLQKDGQIVRLPYFEGKTVCDENRTYRLRETLAPGWYAFKPSGRYLIVEKSIHPEPELWKLKKMIGYQVHEQLITNDIQKKLFHLPEAEEAAKFTPIQAYQWFDGHLIFGSVEFETEVELEVRESFEEERAISGIKGITPALAQAFMLLATERQLAREAEERARRKAEQEAHEEEIKRWQNTVEGRIVYALSHTGAQLLDWRNNGENEAVVRYRLNNQRFECVVDTNTLRIIDSGICLEGEDRELNLSSLPSAVREAIQTGQLYVFRRA